MSRKHCISNRNIRIIAEYVKSRTGDHDRLFQGLPFPADRYPSAEAFFLDEDEWTTYETFEAIFRKAKQRVNEPNFYFNCGASTARLASWGRLHYFARVFASPNEGYQRLPTFNKSFNDTKDMEVIDPPRYDRRKRKVRTLIKVQFHPDFEPNRDYIGDPYLRGIVSAIPTIWGLAPAHVRQRLNPYDPVKLFYREPELARYDLSLRWEGSALMAREPGGARHRRVGEKVLLTPEKTEGKYLFLGRYTKLPPGYGPVPGDTREAVRITRTVQSEGRTLLRHGEIYLAPYIILDVTYDRLSCWHRLAHLVCIRHPSQQPGLEMLQTIDRLRRSVQAKNEAHGALERTHLKLERAKARLDQYAQELEQMVLNRTRELHQAQKELTLLNRRLESRVKEQVVQLDRYKELRRYLSPKLTQEILASDREFGKRPARKMMTVVFSDIRGFSSMTDGLESEELFHLLDRYLSEMIRIVYACDGTLNKILGDGLLIFFNDPIPMEAHAKQAVLMAIEMQKKVDHLKEEWRHFGHTLGIGIGINTGFMTVGNIGCDLHRDYTVIGNQVNLAARLESLCQAGQILISQRTYSLVKESVQAEPVGKVRVKGIHYPVKTYRVVWEPASGHLEGGPS